MKSFILLIVILIILSCGEDSTNPSGEQDIPVWMERNLDVTKYRNGDRIHRAMSDEAWVEAGRNKTGAWCYYNHQPQGHREIYGVLYNWYAVNDPRGLAPEGWHIPTDDEWTELENSLGGSYIAGGKLKSKGTIEDGDGLWERPNDGATNEIGFSAVPAGQYNGWDFITRGEYASFWSSSEYSEDAIYYAWVRSLSNDRVSVSKWFPKGYGYFCSLRQGLEGDSVEHEEQMDWLRMIKDHIIASMTIEKTDFDFSEFADKGGLMKVWSLFGDDLDKLLDEINVELVA